MKKLPFDASFQEKLIRLMYQEPGFGEVAADYLDPKIFDNRVHRWVAEKVRWAAHDLGSSLTATIIQNERRKDIGLGLIRRQDAPAFKAFFATRLHKPVPDRTYIKQEVQRFVKHQKARDFVLKAADEFLPEHDFEGMDKAMSDVLDLDLTGDNSLGSYPAKGIKKRIKQRAKAIATGVATGINGLDRLMIQGGVPPKQLAAVLAPTGRGKTNWLIDRTACAVLEGVPVIYYTLELETDVIETRMDARFTGVPMRLLKNNAADVEEEWDKIASRVADNLIVKEYPTGSLSVGMIKEHLRRLERHAFYPKLVVVDYADIMKPRVEYKDSSYETQGLIWQELRGLAMEHKVAVWTGTQGNRESMKDEHGNVDLEHMAESAKKAMIADVVIALNQSKKEEKDSRMRAYVAKNRNGPRAREIPLKVDHSTCSFKEA